jgi:hypothetical protein
MTILLFILSLMGGCAAAWLCKKYFDVASCREWPPLTSSEPNLGGVHHWCFFRWYARDGVSPTGARLIDALIAYSGHQTVVLHAASFDYLVGAGE